ncbi:glycosyltransferase family 2 protein [Thiomicrorhabdus hydrogeniphila]
MIGPMIELNKNYSTTRRVQKMDAELVIAEIKAAYKPEDKFETVLFLPEGEGRQGEGGLRTQGHFKKKQEDKTLVTVVTVVYNGEQFLEKTILSVINQTYDNVEYIIIDGGSTDGTLDIIRKYEHAIDYWVSEKDKGIYDAMNRGILLATGRVLSLLNCGDYFVDNALIKVGDFFLSNKPTAILTGGVIKYDEAHEFILESNNESFNKLIDYTMPCNHPSTFIPLLVYKVWGRFDDSYKICGDYDLIYRLNHFGVDFYFSNFMFVKMQLGGVSEVYNSILQRAIEHYTVRIGKLNNFYNFYLSCKLYVVESFRHLVKLLISKRLLIKYRNIKHTSNLFK